MGDDFGASGGEFGRAGHVGGTDAQRDYRGSEGGLGGQDRSTEFGHGGVRTQDRFDNTGATGTGAYGDRTDDNYGSRDRSDNLGSTGTGAFDRTDDTHGSRGRTDNFGLTGSGAGRDDFDRGDDTYGSSGTGRGYDNTTGTQHKPTMGEKVKGASVHPNLLRNMT